MRIKIKKLNRLSASFRGTVRSMKGARATTLGALAKEWARVVKTTTWFYPKPSPDALVIRRFNARSTRFLRVGWIDYPGSHRAAHRRLMLRKPIMDRRGPRIVHNAYRLKVGK